MHTCESLWKRGKYHGKLLSNFSARWKNECLLSRLEAYRPKGSMLRRRSLETLQSGEIVLDVKVILYVGGKKVLNRSLKHLIHLRFAVLHCTYLRFLS